MMISKFQTECQLISAAVQLGARTVEGWSRAETTLAENIAPYPTDAAGRLQKQILGGRDPLGDAFCNLRSPELRRNQGATYTPTAVAQVMISWATALKFNPARIVDPGAGSARFLLAAARKFPDARLVGIEVDPLAAIIARGNLAAAGLGSRSKVIVSDYRKAALPEVEGKTLFIGNPPYVRHHHLDAKGKEWLTAEAKKLGFNASQLAGLHVHFYLATVLKARKDDFGVFITSERPWRPRHNGCRAHLPDLHRRHNYGRNSAVRYRLPAGKNQSPARCQRRSKKRADGRAVVAPRSSRNRKQMVAPHAQSEGSEGRLCRTG
jgi:adenine-specific DNA-methyltransferase